MFLFHLKFHWSLFTRSQLTILRHWAISFCWSQATNVIRKSTFVALSSVPRNIRSNLSTRTVDITYVKSCIFQTLWDLVFPLYRHCTIEQNIKPHIPHFFKCGFSTIVWVFVTTECIFLQCITYSNSNGNDMSIFYINSSSPLLTIFFLLIKMTRILKDISSYIFCYEVLFGIDWHRSYGVLVPNRRQDIIKKQGRPIPPTYILVTRPRRFCRLWRPDTYGT